LFKVRAFSTLGCAELELEEALALAAQYSLGAIEIRALGGTTDLPAYFAARFGTTAGLARVLATAPVQVCALNTSMRLIGATREAREAFLRYLPWAEAAGIPTLRVFDGGGNGNDREMAEAVATLGWWRETRRAEGFASDIIVETHDALVHPETLGRFLDAAPDCALLWDSHHTWRKGGQEPAQTWQLVRRNVRHIHVKDSLRRPPPEEGADYVLPGKGQFPMEDLLRVLAEDAYTGVLSLEWERLWHDELPPLHEALQVAARTGWWRPQ
jgi:sugar phosphate isomerase/epimerase